MPHQVLAIDDNPERYLDLDARLVGLGIDLICMQNPHAVRMFLRHRTPLAILLDHDMPAVVEGEIFHDWNGMHYLEQILPGGVPVIITSANPAAAIRMEYLAWELGITTHRRSILQRDHTDAWVDLIEGYAIDPPAAPGSPARSST